MLLSSLSSCTNHRNCSSQVKYTGYRAITAGLQADTYIEAFDVEKQKIEYTELSADSTQEATVLAIARDVDPYGKLASSIGE